MSNHHAPGHRASTRRTPHLTAAITQRLGHAAIAIALCTLCGGCLHGDTAHSVGHWRFEHGLRTEVSFTQRKDRQNSDQAPALHPSNSLRYGLNDAVELGGKLARTTAPRGALPATPGAPLC